jgi:2-polyprenyl-3-methyl-5-hydroxy-6-metoxy-1,4-benzoquinol methylase
VQQIEMIDWTDDAITRFWTHTKFSTEEYFTFVFGKAIVKEFSLLLNPGIRVLDYGCGIGCLVEHLLKKKVCVTAADNSPAAVETVNKKFKNVGLFNGAFGIQELSQKNGKFDIIMAVEVIEHMSDAKLKDFMANARKLLSEKGRLVVTTPNNEDLSKQMVYCPNCAHVFHRVQHVRSWTEATLRDFFESNEFNVVSIYTTDFSTKNLSFLERKKVKLKKLLVPRPKVEEPHLVGVFSV